MSGRRATRGCEADIRAASVSPIRAPWWCSLHGMHPCRWFEAPERPNGTRDSPTPPPTCVQHVERRLHLLARQVHLKNRQEGAGRWVHIHSQHACHEFVILPCNTAPRLVQLHLACASGGAPRPPAEERSGPASCRLCCHNPVSAATTPPQRTWFSAHRRRNSSGEMKPSSLVSYCGERQAHN